MALVRLIWFGFFTSKTEGFHFYFLNVWLSSGQYTQINGPNYLIRVIVVNGLDVRVKLAWLAESYFFTELTFQEIAEQFINHLIFSSEKKRLWLVQLETSEKNRNAFSLEKEQPAITTLLSDPGAMPQEKASKCPLNQALVCCLHGKCSVTVLPGAKAYATKSLVPPP